MGDEPTQLKSTLNIAALLYSSSNKDVHLASRKTADCLRIRCCIFIKFIPIETANNPLYCKKFFIKLLNVVFWHDRLLLTEIFYSDHLADQNFCCFSWLQYSSNVIITSLVWVSALAHIYPNSKKFMGNCF